MACRNRVLHYSAKKLLVSLREVWADKKNIKALFENFLVTGSAHILSEGVLESVSNEKVDQIHYALQSSLTKSINKSHRN
jgi:hypothetical protein